MTSTLTNQVICLDAQWWSLNQFATGVMTALFVVASCVAIYLLLRKK